MADPYKVEPPARISFSGGRSSGYMLYRVMQAHGGALPDGVEVMFANTGKEHQATLDFVRDCGKHWGVPIHWIELDVVDGKMVTKTVDYDTASREGEPFAALVRHKKMLPNFRMRFCTQELKVNRLFEKMTELGYDPDAYADCIGIRADEPRRVANIRKSEGGRDILMPMAEAGDTHREVMQFWAGRNFNLGLPVSGKNTLYGNCDLCFLKGTTANARAIAMEPERAEWWIEIERSLPQRLDKSKADFGHSTFRMGVSYQQLRDKAIQMNQQDILFSEDELIPVMDCTNCTD